ncbi:MAG: hypothetical protein KBE09_02230 [Candidatus Pacebacteria bacterium]|nr:hypothetical protein [Candidatus Paceibacterota bacterium]
MNSRKYVYVLLTGLFVLVGGGLLGVLWYYPSTAQAQRAFIEKGMFTCLEDRGNFWRRACMQDLAAAIGERMETRDALKALSVLDDEPPIKYSCHILVHYIGQDLYAQTKNVPASFATCAQTVACGEGCFHGTIERYMEETGDLLTGDAAAQLCAKESMHNEITYRACNHGIGHASMLLNDQDVPRSLAACDVLPEELQRECQSGVFMEDVFTSASDEQSTKYRLGTDFNQACVDLPERYRAMCYQAQASAVIMTDPRRYRAAVEFCAQVPEPYRNTCYREPGGDIVVVSTDPTELRNVCGMVPDGEARKGCIHEGLYFAIQMEAGNTKKVGRYCDAFGELEYRTACYYSLGVVSAQWDAAGVVRMCEEAPRRADADRASCIAGSQVPRL